MDFALSPKKRGIGMTVASQLKQTITSLQGAASSMANYALHHPDRQVKELFQDCQHEVELILQELNHRLQEIEFEEPQFRGF
jgi:hypothetical protein